MPTPLDYQLTEQPQTDGDLSAINYQATPLLTGDLVVLDVANQIGGAVPGMTFWNSPGIAVRKPASGSPATGSIGAVAARIDPRPASPANFVGNPQAGTGGAIIGSSFAGVGTIRTRGIVLVTFRGACAAGHLVSICTVAGFEGRAQAAASAEESLAQCLVTAADGDIAPIRLFGSVCIVP